MNEEFDREQKENARRLTGVGRDLDSLIDGRNQRRKRINDLIEEASALAAGLDCSVDVPERLTPLKKKSNEDQFAMALSAVPQEQRRDLQERFFASVPAVPPFDKLDIFVLFVLGGMSLLTEFLLVGMPKETKWVPSNEGGIVPTGWLTEKIQSWNVPEDNWLSSLCKVPFDKVRLPEPGLGFNPVNHRLLSIGHDPSPIGLVYGLMDIASGGMSAVTSKGTLFHLPGTPAGPGKLIMAPLLWVGHLMSDVATPMGLPVPGQVLTQLLHVPAPGHPESATVAQVGRAMYTGGYDFRRYLVGGIVPALIEIVLRTYHFVRYVYPQHIGTKRNPVSALRAEKFSEDAQTEARLKSLLFWGHATAASINAGKVAIQGFTGSYFAAVQSINILEWQVFAVRTIQYLFHRFRDTLVEQVVSNRRLLNERWDQLSEGQDIYGALGAPRAPRLSIVYRGQS